MVGNEKYEEFAKAENEKMRFLLEDNLSKNQDLMQVIDAQNQMLTQKFDPETVLDEFDKSISQLKEYRQEIGNLYFEY